MIAIAPSTWIFVCTASTDMRKGFCGLSGLVKQHFKIDLLSGHLFLFFNGRRDHVKILSWDIDGLSIWSWRLESGSFERLNRSTDGHFYIDSAEPAVRWFEFWWQSGRRDVQLGHIGRSARLRCSGLFKSQLASAFWGQHELRESAPRRLANLVSRVDSCVSR